MESDYLQLSLSAIRVFPVTLVVLLGLTLNWRKRKQQPRAFLLFVLAGLVEFATIFLSLLTPLFLWNWDDAQMLNLIISMTIHETLNALCWSLLLWGVLINDNNSKTIPANSI